jgi:ribosomal-protein-alanine N-acetyltransferase
VGAPPSRRDLQWSRRRWRRIPRAPKGGEVEIGYGIVPTRQGRGYATEAVSTLASLALTMPDVVAVVASTDAGNVASQRVLEKAGFQLVD